MSQGPQRPARRSDLGFTIIAGLVMIGLAAFLATRTPASSPTGTSPSSPTLSLLSSPTPATKRIGILAGHWQYDGGATCDGVIFEADLTYQIAQKTAPPLESQGYEVDILAEKDPRLPGYQAAVFLALHIDSCGYNLSGFKVAHSDESFIPEIEDRLVDCVYREYEKATGLPRHDTTISHNMLKYYALHPEVGGIAAQTPGAIIEMGFMDGDFDLLANRQEVVAQGLAQGLLCFLEGTGGS